MSGSPGGPSVNGTVGEPGINGAPSIDSSPGKEYVGVLGGCTLKNTATLPIAPMQSSNPVFRILNCAFYLLCVVVDLESPVTLALLVKQACPDATFTQF